MIKGLTAVTSGQALDHLGAECGQETTVIEGHRAAQDRRDRPSAASCRPGIKILEFKDPGTWDLLPPQRP